MLMLSSGIASPAGTAVSAWAASSPISVLWRGGGMRARGKHFWLVPIAGHARGLRTLMVLLRPWLGLLAGRGGWNFILSFAGLVFDGLAKFLRVG